MALAQGRGFNGVEARVRVALAGACCVTPTVMCYVLSFTGWLSVGAFTRWLDQLQPCQQRRQQGVPDQHSPPQASQVQQQQQQQQHALMNRAQQHAGEHQQHARMSDAQAQGLWQEASSFNKLAGAGGAGAGGAGVGGAGHFSAHNGAVVQCSPGSS